MSKIYTLVLLFIFLSGNAYGFKINPMNRYIVTPPGSVADQFSEPVHERITRLARDRFVNRCLQETPNEPACKLNSNPRSVIQDSLIRGIWWNDDPDQDIYKISALTWLGHMWDAKRRANSGKYVIDDKYMMQYRSHYGDLQFIHSMASTDGESATKTKEKIFMWAEFAYRMAIGELKPATKLKQVKVAHLSDFFARQIDWKLRYIMEPKYRLKDTPNDFADHALGSFLHMVQDSYSAAHVERNHSSSAKCPNGSIRRFMAYTHQSAAKHGEADTWSAYRSSRYTQLPIDVSAQLIWFARRHSDWDRDVAPYLDRVVYCFDEKPKPAGPGLYNK